MGWRMAFFLSENTLRDTSCIAVLRVEIVNWVSAILRGFDWEKDIRGRMREIWFDYAS